MKTPEQFQQVVDDYLSTYQPTNPVERDLVEEMIGAKWRIRRLKTLEVALIDYEMESIKPELQKKRASFDAGIHAAASFKSLTDASRSLALLTRYESRLHRIFQRAHQMFLDLRKAVVTGLLRQPKPSVQPTEMPPPSVGKKETIEPSRQMGVVAIRPAQPSSKPTTYGQPPSRPAPSER